MALTDPFELPSLEEIERMENQLLSIAIEALEISDDYVVPKMWYSVPLLRTLTKPSSISKTDQVD